MKTYSRKKGDSPSNVIIHVNELCRLCLAKEEEMVPIYDDETIPLSLRIMACVNLEVSFIVSLNRPDTFYRGIDYLYYAHIFESLSKNRNLVYLSTCKSILLSFSPGLLIILSLSILGIPSTLRFSFLFGSVTHTLL